MNKNIWNPVCIYHLLLCWVIFGHAFRLSRTTSKCLIVDLSIYCTNMVNIYLHSVHYITFTNDLDTKWMVIQSTCNMTPVCALLTLTCIGTAVLLQWLSMYLQSYMYMYSRSVVHNWHMLQCLNGFIERGTEKGSKKILFTDVHRTP